MTLIVTTAGLAASLDAANKGIKLKIKKIGFGNAGYVPSKDQTSLKAEFLRTEFTDSSVSSNTLNMSVVFDDLNQSFDAKEIGYYLEDDTLFAVDSLNGAILSSKHKGAILTESFELVLSDNLIDSITVDVIGVSRATEANVGIAKIATINEAFDVENDCDIVTPKKLHDVLDERVVNNLFINGCFSVNERFGKNALIDAKKVQSFFADRWRVRPVSLVGGTITYKTSDYVSLSSGGSCLQIWFSNSSSSWYMSQRIELTQYDLNEILDRDITVSINMSSSVPILASINIGIIDHSIQTTISDWISSSRQTVSSKNIYEFTVRIPARLKKEAHMSSLALQVDISFRGVDSESIPDSFIEFYSAKCEFGTNSTRFVADDPAVTKMNCQRFFQKGFWDYRELHSSTSDQQLCLMFSLPTEMRAKPALSYVPSHGTVVSTDTEGFTKSYRLRVTPQALLGWDLWTSGNVTLDAEI